MKIKHAVACEHEFVFDLKTRLAVYPAIVKGVCKKCGKQIAITKEVYEASYKDKTE